MKQIRTKLMIQNTQNGILLSRHGNDKEKRSMPILPYKITKVVTLALQATDKEWKFFRKHRCTIFSQSWIQVQQWRQFPIRTTQQSNFCTHFQMKWFGNDSTLVVWNWPQLSITGVCWNIWPSVMSNCPHFLCIFPHSWKYSLEVLWQFNVVTPES